MAKATTMGPMKIKESASYRVFKVFNAIILTLISVAMLYPFLYLVAQSFSSTEAIVAGEVGLIPKDFNISTYKYVITDGKFIPYYGNTIVYSIIGTVCALLFSALLWRGITLAAHAPDRFGALLVVGFVVQVALQAVLNIAVVTNTIPNTGISLPFFSSGGTSLMMLLGEMGIVLSVSRQADAR